MHFKRLLTVLFILYITPSFVFCQSTDVIKTSDGLLVTLDNQNKNDVKRLKLNILSDDIIQIIASPSSSFSSQKSLIAIKEDWNKIPFDVRRHDTTLIVTTKLLHIHIQLNSGVISFYDKDNHLLLRENGREYIPTEIFDEKTYQIQQNFTWNNHEAIYGLGQHPDGHYNYRGKTVELVQENIKVAIPVFLSTNGYGILWDNYSETQFNDKEGSYLRSKAGDEINYYFLYGPEFDRVISNYRTITGAAPMYPKWAYGYFQSRNRYWTQEELLNTVHNFRRLSIPLDVIVLDYMHWGKYGFGSFQFDEAAFPNPHEMIDKLHNDYNCKLLVSIWPSFSKNTKHWNSMKSRGYLLEDVDSYDGTQVYDAYNPDAGQLYWDWIKESYYTLGVDGWWLDATEPENVSQYRKSKNYMGSSEKYLNTYSLMDSKHLYEGQRNTFSNKRVYILTRSSFAGQQRYAATTWSGDIKTTFEELKAQIPAGLNFCMSGVPYWTTDIGGYRGGDPGDPEYRELFIRWFQYGTFCPIFRSHGRRFPGDRKTPNEPWSYGENAQEILTQYTHFRYRLMPYIYSSAWSVTNEGYTIMRGLAFDFRNDTRVYNIDDQFMFGNALLISPVVAPHAKSRKVYLPKNVKWFDFWSGRVYDGGQTLTIETPLDKIPIFVKAGSIIPMGPFLQYSTEKPANPIEVRVYQGADAEFEIYEDENDNYNYENGIYSIIKIRWNDAKQTLAFFDREGKYPGLLEERIFNIIWVKQGHGFGISLETKTDKIVHYKGKKIVINYSDNK